jgi:CheY-like chemotaxis protein
MSHEIRTPLNAMIGLGYLLEQTALNHDQLQFISKIQFASRSLLCVVNDVLDLSKIEAGEMSLEDEPFDLRELVRDLGQMLSPQAQAKGIDLIVQPSSELPGMVIGDVSRLRQIFINLLNNAIKFTEVGEVELKAFCTDSGADRIHLRCLVNDTGIGIEPVALARLFSPFTQADASTTRRFGGTGLGLSIARRIVEVMGGEIGVTSTKGAGSSFWFEVPLRVVQSGSTIQRVETTANIRIIIADSDAESAGIMRARLHALGLSAEVVGTREQLLRLVGNPDPEVWPDMIVLAPRLQDFDAYQVIRELQHGCPHRELPPVIILADTAGVAAQHQELRRADCVLLRPVTSSALFNAVNTAVWGLKDGHDRIVQTTNLEGRNAQWLSGVRVLVVDDSDINREVAQRILESQGAIVSCCSDGAGAFEHLRTLQEPVDLVLMDVQMPVLDGNEATRRIRAELNLRSLPIVALTAGALSGERQRAIEAGMNDFISKPFDPQVLIRKTRRLVERARNQPLPMVLVSSPISVPATQQPYLSSIDSSAVRRMFGDDLSLFKALLGRIVHEYSDLALPVTEPADDAMRSQLVARVHKLKGSAGMLGANRVMKAASAAEKALSTGQPAAVAGATLHQLASALTILREESEEFLGSPLKQSVDAVDTPQHASLSGADLLELRELLSSHNLAALDKFNALSEPLMRALGPVPFDRLKQAVADLDFPAGVRVLRGATLLKGSMVRG